MKWSEKLKSWKDRKGQTYPKGTENFFWETSVLYKDKDSNYIEKFIQDKSLNNKKENYSKFKNAFNSTGCKDVAAQNSKNDSFIYVIPKPRDGKNFSSMKNFIDEATEGHQKKFWTRVVSNINKFLKTHDKAYVSYTGNTPYFHVRIESNPRYYKSKNLLK